MFIQLTKALDLCIHLLTISLTISLTIYFPSLPLRGRLSYHPVSSSNIVYTVAIILPALASFYVSISGISNLDPSSKCLFKLPMRIFRIPYSILLSPEKEICILILLHHHHYFFTCTKWSECSQGRGKWYRSCRWRCFHWPGRNWTGRQWRIWIEEGWRKGRYW